VSANRLKNTSSDSMSTYQNLTYDAIGRLTNDDSIARSYHYDYRNMISLLTQAHNLPDGITRKDTMICTYNYKNQRVMKLQKHRWWNQMCGGGGGEMSQPQGGGTGKGTDAGGGTSLTMGPPSQLPEGCLVESMQATFYVWSGNEVIAEYNESNELKYQYVYANGMRIAQLKKNSGTSKDTTYLHADYQGSTRLQTKPDKTTYAKIDYDVWGQVRQQSGYPSAYTYTGQEWDDENSANLFYLHARYYDPKLGRFTTPDPLPSDLNPYSYCNNNPVMLTDVSGMLPPMIQISWSPKELNASRFSSPWYLSGGGGFSNPLNTSGITVWADREDPFRPITPRTITIPAPSGIPIPDIPGPVNYLDDLVPGSSGTSAVYQVYPDVLVPGGLNPEISVNLPESDALYVAVQRLENVPAHVAEAYRKMGQAQAGYQRNTAGVSNRLMREHLGQDPIGYFGGRPLNNVPPPLGGGIGMGGDIPDPYWWMVPPEYQQFPHPAQWQRDLDHPLHSPAAVDDLTVIKECQKTIREGQ
jgi:RHS repeat-associated protein